MFSLRKPTPEQIARFLQDCQESPFSYQEVGATRGEMPKGYVRDAHRWRVGQGEPTFELAADAIRHWEMYPADVVDLHERTAAVEPGVVVAPLIRLLGVWAMVACRIVYVIDRREADGRRLFGFAYGSLAAHAERGEEQFLIEYDPSDDSVWYHLKAFSRPGHVLAALAFPFVRRLQRRFAARSLASLQQALAESLAEKKNQ
jgi:uncharacterized protein (UPF0548 family)